MAYEVGSYFSSATAILSYFSKGNGKPEQKLDPLSTIIRLALLSRELPYTRLSIANNTITFIPPGLANAARGVKNFFAKEEEKDKRDDLILLKKPIALAMALWPAKESEKMKKFYEAVKKAYEIFKKTTYEHWTSGVREEAIDEVIKMLDAEIAKAEKPKPPSDLEQKIKSALEGKKNDESIDKVMRLVNEELTSINKPKPMSETEKKIKEVWSQEQLDAAATLFACEDKDCDESLKIFLLKKDRDFREMLKSLVSP